MLDDAIVKFARAHCKFKKFFFLFKIEFNIKLDMKWKKFLVYNNINIYVKCTNKFYIKNFFYIKFI